MSKQEIDLVAQISRFVKMFRGESGPNHFLMTQENDYLYSLDGVQWVRLAKKLLGDRIITKVVSTGHPLHHHFLVTDTGEMIINGMMINNLYGSSVNTKVYVEDVVYANGVIYVLSNDNVVGTFPLDTIPILMRDGHRIIYLESIRLLDTKETINRLVEYEGILLAYDKAIHASTLPRKYPLFVSMDGTHWDTYDVSRVDILINRILKHKEASKGVLRKVFNRLHDWLDAIQYRLGV